MQENIKYSIDIASKKSGLAKNTIRAWENRYNFLYPERSDTKRRLYSEEEIEKLFLLNEAVKSGYRIGNIYQYSDDDLKRLVSKSGTKKILNYNQSVDFSEFINSIKQFDEINFKKLLDTALIQYSKPEFLTIILLPLIEEIGDLWKKGILRISQEHFATSIINSLLVRMRESEKLSESSRRIVVCTPIGERHELGALIVSVLLSSLGWKVIYLGADLPVEEIAFAVKSTNSIAAALSVIFPNNETRIYSEIENLSKYLPDKSIIIGSKTLDKELFSNTKNLYFTNEINSIIEILEEIS
jgi:methanogenic corrinoid protein MtbC1